MESFEACGIILVHLGELSNVESFEACGVILVHLGESSCGVI